MSGRFFGVGVGPGDPELITRKGARIIGAADVIAYHAGPGKESNARRIAASLFPEGLIEEQLTYPVTTGSTDHPGGYEGALADFYEACAVTLAAHLDAGRDVVLLAEGDPLFYSSYMYMHDRLADSYQTEIVPGVPAFTAATATAGLPLTRQTDTLSVLSGTMPEPELARRLADTDAAIIMKLGHTFPAVRRALVDAGRIDQARYVEQASTPEQRWLPVAEVEPGSVPYFSLIIVPGDARNGRRSRDLHRSPTEPQQPDTAPATAAAELRVIGLGPGPDAWVTPEASAALAQVRHVVGYAPYVNRVPQRPGLQRHASGNTVELDRARHALELAKAGEPVAVVSGGDAGVFGMAAAVYEAAEDPSYTGVPIRVLPGITAVQAVAARAGAPVGADFAVMSLSDRLKPWGVVEKRLRAVAAEDFVLAIYNPASRTRTEQIGRARDLLLEHRKPDTVVVVGRDIGRAEETLTVTTLAELDVTTIDMLCLLIIGAGSTRVAPAGVWTPRFVP